MMILTHDGSQRDTGHTHQNEVNVQEDDYYHINPVRSLCVACRIWLKNQ